MLHWFRRFDDYQALKLASRWQPLPEYRADEFTVGIMGAGVLGAKVAESLQPWGSRFASGAVAANPGRRCRASPAEAELGEFLQGTRVLINLLPNTAETAGIINQTLLAQLPDESYVLNLARGVHVVEEDLLAALNSGKLKGAMLDVFSREPLPQESPLWAHPRVAMTPHVAAVTRPMEAITYIAETISRLERGGAGKRSGRPPARLLRRENPATAGFC
ncbi:hypothetical protein IE990_25230 [Klebsiella pneumoniae]|uniref:D-isomer specific 2-hydroxyacid dehydrogenase NAD-binding domain-containing protein n=1 Tax=Klebsiella pneumoniae TaxID=573 RepID=A0A927HKC8_KLEPN|nr:hypothetical protein [Klebsiella pneumoniae]